MLTQEQKGFKKTDQEDVLKNNNTHVITCLYWAEMV